MNNLRATFAAKDDSVLGEYARQFGWDMSWMVYKKITDEAHNQYVNSIYFVDDTTEIARLMSIRDETCIRARDNLLTAMFGVA